MAKKTPPVIRFTAQVWQLKTLVDGGVNVTLALSDKDIAQVAQLLECKKAGALLEVAAVPILQSVKNVEKTKADQDRKGNRRRERYPYRA